MLLALLAIEGGTLISLQTFFSWHIFVGMLLVPPVALKIASTGYRFARYYTQRPDYVAAGPPPTLLRLLGPVVVLSTVGLFATGVALAAFGPGQPFVLLLHKASFVVWVGSVSLHVLGHVRRAPSLVMADLRGRRVGGYGARGLLVAAAVFAGAILAVATVSLIGPWTHALGFGG